MYHTTQEIDSLFGGPPTTLTHIPIMITDDLALAATNRDLRIAFFGSHHNVEAQYQAEVDAICIKHKRATDDIDKRLAESKARLARGHSTINPFDYIHDNDCDKTPSGVFKIKKIKPTKTRATNYKPELKAWMKQTATKRFGDLFYDSRPHAKTISNIPQRTESAINWQIHRAKLYKKAFEKECMIKVGQKWFQKPCQIPKCDQALQMVCSDFHMMVLEAHDQHVPENACLIKAIPQRRTVRRKNWA